LSKWTSGQGNIVYSYTMLTINAAEHPLMRRFHKPTDEKRMVVILPVERYADWLQASPAQSREFMQLFPADQLVASEPAVDRGLF